MDVSKLALICRGSDSEIYRYGTAEQAVVLKMVPSSSSKQCRHLSNEYKILSALDHQNVIKVHRYKQQMLLHETTKNVLVMESATHGSLLDFYKKARLTINQIRWIFSELCEAVLYLHCNYIVHRDLKLENVLVSQNESQIQIKLSDFGFASSTQQSHLSNAYKGTRRGFMAPEIHKVLQAPQVQYDMFKADIFALGVILFTIVLGRLPFQYATAQNSHYKCIIEERFEDFWNMHRQALSKLQNIEGANVQDFKQIFLDMVKDNYQSRPSIEKVMECSWLTGRQQIIKSMKKISSETRKTAAI